MGFMDWLMGGEQDTAAAQQQRAAQQALAAQFQQQAGQNVLDPRLGQALMAGALGTAPSAAEIFGRSQLESLQRGMLGQAAGAQGVNPALAFRQATQAGQQAGLESIAQFQGMRAQEMAQAQQLAAQAMFQERAAQLASLQGASGAIGAGPLPQQREGFLGKALGGLAQGAISGLAFGAVAGKKGS